MLGWVVGGWDSVRVTVGSERSSSRTASASICQGTAGPESHATPPPLPLLLPGRLLATPSPCARHEARPLSVYPRCSAIV
ncbi:unnamed protein product [Lampetra planeri]